MWCLCRLIASVFFNVSAKNMFLNVVFDKLCLRCFVWIVSVCQWSLMNSRMTRGWIQGTTYGWDNAHRHVASKRLWRSWPYKDAGMAQNHSTFADRSWCLPVLQNTPRWWRDLWKKIAADNQPETMTASCAKKLKSLSGYGWCIMISFGLSPGATSFWPGRYWPSGRRWDCAGRWAIIDKQFDDGGYPWVLTGDKATKSSLKQELSNMPGSVFNFGRESEAYVPTKPSSTHQKQGLHWVNQLIWTLVMYDFGAIWEFCSCFRWVNSE